MALIQDIPELIEYVEQHKPLIKHNEKLFDIYEGNLLPYVEGALEAQLSVQSFAQIKHRIAPINVLVRIIDKLSKIYQQQPTRKVVGGNEADEELVKWYEKEFRMNSKFNISNEFSNLFKNNLIQPFVHENQPKLRIIPSDRFLQYSNDDVDPTEPTHTILYMGNVPGDTSTGVLHVYTDEEFIIVDTRGNRRDGDMRRVDNIHGVNPYGTLPFSYVNQSSNLIIPKVDTDQLKMTVLLPVLLSDLNYAVMFQAFSILYTLNAKLPDGFKMAPNAVWPLEGIDEDDKPDIGQIKPQVDINEVLNLIQSELAFWLNSKGIRPGAIGQMNSESFASGISKMIDEMDVTEARNKQVSLYRDVEADFWDLLLNHMHPVWVKLGLVENTTIFSSGAEVITNFSEQIPLIRRGEIIRDLKEEVAAGFTTRREAIERLNPRMGPDDVEKLLAEIDEERGFSAMETEDEEDG